MWGLCWHEYRTAFCQHQCRGELGTHCRLFAIHLFGDGHYFGRGLSAFLLLLENTIKKVDDKHCVMRLRKPATQCFLLALRLQNARGILENMPLLKMDHSTLIVSDLAKARWFYEEVLGLEVVPRPS